MTSSIENRIDEWIARVKARPSMAAFAFLPGYPAHKTPNPVTKYTVAVAEKEIKASSFFIGDRTGLHLKGKLFDVWLCLRVYAPEGSSGSSLLRASAMLTDAFEAEDRECAVAALSLSGIGYDTASRTEYRDVVARLSMLSEEAVA